MAEVYIKKVDQFNFLIDQQLPEMERILTENKESQIFQRVIVYCKDVPAAEHIDGHYDSHNDHTDTNR